MAAAPVGPSLMQGDFLDEVVESTLRSMVDTLKAEYRKELGKALEAAKLENVSKTSACRGDDPLVMPVQPLNTPFTEFGEDKSGPAGELQTANPSISPVMENAGAAGCMRTSIKNGGPRGSTQSNTSKTMGARKGSSPRSPRSPLGRRRSGSESMHSDKLQGILTEEEQEAFKTIRKEEIAKEEALIARREARNYLEMPVPEDTSQCKMLSYHIVANPKFDIVMGVIIAINALTIGAETSITRNGHEIPVFLHILENTFLILYCVELAMRVYVCGAQKAFSNNWVKFDAVLVASGILNLMLSVVSSGSDSTAAGLVDNVNMLKVFRLFRLAKTVRLIVQFRTFYMLVHGLMAAVLPMFWTLILMLLVIYVFAVIAMETIVVSDEENDYSAAAHRFDTIGGAMLTLMQFMTLDSIAPIYRPLILEKPLVAAYIVGFLLIGPVALINTVTAIMVEASLRTANEDQDAKKAWDKMRRKNLMPKLRNMFMALDVNGDGEVDLAEILRAPPDIQDAIQHIVGLDELEEVFCLMDFDESGSIDIDEFVDGIMRSQADKPSELFVLVKQGKAVLEAIRGKDSELRRVAWAGGGDGGAPSPGA